MQAELQEEPEPFFADEDADWEPYAETEKEEAEQEAEFDEEYQRYLDEMAEAMLNDKALRDEIIKEISAIGEGDLTKGDAELLRIASALLEEDIRTEADEQERQICTYFLFPSALFYILYIFHFSSVHIFLPVHLLTNILTPQWRCSAAPHAARTNMSLA